MTAATTPRNTPRRERGIVVVPVAASTLVRQGLIACVNATGFAVEGSTATTLTYLGNFVDTVNNVQGNDGDEYVQVRTNHALFFENSATDPVTQASLGKACYIEDNQTVAATNGTNTRSKAGIVVGIETDGVWVE